MVNKSKISTAHTEAEFLCSDIIITDDNITAVIYQTLKKLRCLLTGIWIAPLRISIGIKLPSILVGNKIDLRGHTSLFGKRLFNFSCGDKMRKVFDLCLYHECSSVSGKAIPDLSWLAIALALDPHFVM
ncbi:hypothetical protein CEXT_133391 [Caerostris extrusa]|uniref:Uncharacterized protein n=1 Tax=Caerostris extrusa TaxID=172846 RepID=A0AAV4NNC0_CAEEX|nr:hypothetical protein CEXT_133391 [Caerostris extrusa]